ncbi:MAG: formate dehydrogenase accessory sulfurtransferase FdhD [Candidatus Promineifilaceae bacterium]
MIGELTVPSGIESDNPLETIPAGTKPTTYISLGDSFEQVVDGEVVEESQTCIAVNGRELATVMCSPRELKWMAVGFLYNEGLIQSLDEVRSLHISASESCVDVWLHDLDREMPKRFIVTAGCGGGVTFDDLSQKHAPLTAELSVRPEQLAGLMRQLHMGAELYQRARGIHTAVLADGSEILIQVEDIGRHNCLDKLAGAALMEGIQSNGRILLSSGRISSEMINKARRLETPIVCSRTSPTSLSVALAESWNMTIVAYLRQDRMRVYTHPERILIK